MNPYNHVICDIESNLIHPTYFSNAVIYISNDIFSLKNIKKSVENE